MIIGERIKKKRNELGYSQQNLGDLIGVTKVSVCGYESGNRIPTIEKFSKLIEVLDTTADYLLGYDVNVVEEKTNYKISMAKEDIQIIRELKKHPELYNKFVENPARTIELISRRVK